MIEPQWLTWLYFILMPTIESPANRDQVPHGSIIMTLPEADLLTFGAFRHWNQLYRMDTTENSSKIDTSALSPLYSYPESASLTSKVDSLCMLSFQQNPPASNMMLCSVLGLCGRLWHPWWVGAWFKKSARSHQQRFNTKSVPKRQRKSQ